MSVVLELPPRERRVVPLRGPLHMPLAGELTRKVRALVRAGERSIVLDLAGVSSIDAAGIGVLMQEHRRMMAVNGALRIVRARRRVRRPLQLVGVFGLLSDEPR